jgi:hypothetical protein
MSKRLDTRVSPATARGHGIGVHSPRPSTDFQPRTDTYSPSHINDGKRRTSRQNKFLSANTQQSPHPSTQLQPPFSPACGTSPSTEFGDVSQIIDEGWIDGAIDINREFEQPERSEAAEADGPTTLTAGMDGLGLIDNLSIRINDQELFMRSGKSDAPSMSSEDEYESEFDSSSLDANWFEEGSPTNGEMKSRVARKVATGGKWGKDEDLALRDIVATHGAKNWRNVAELLGVRNFECFLFLKKTSHVFTTFLF